MLATLLVVLVIGFGLYTIKKGSADGRVLIWQVTSQLIKQKPITGHGSGAFAALYMNELANWFEAGKGTETQSMVAGSPEATFNEALKLWLEKGLLDRKSTRLNSSHVRISYAVFCLKKKKKT